MLALAAVPSAAAGQRLLPVSEPLAGGDPLAFDPAQLQDFERRAAFGHSHTLYARSPGGVLETARRTARFRSRIVRAARGSGFSPDVLEAIVFVESAGRANAVGGGGPLAPSGLTQITGRRANRVLGMDVKLYASGVLTRKIARANGPRARRLEARRRQVDGRFAPTRALRTTVRYLVAAREQLGRKDLAVASWGMGTGTLRSALRAYDAGPVPYTQLYFDSAPDRHPRAWRLLGGSRHYYFEVLAAKRIMRLYRRDRGQLAALARLHAAKLSAEEVMHPPTRTRVFPRSTAIVAARRRGVLQPVPRTRSLRVAAEAGELARRLGRSPSVYRALRPASLATLLYMSERVRKLSGSSSPLLLTSGVRDGVYQRVLMRRNVMAARVYSIHTTGWAFDIARPWATKRQAAAVQFVLERLQSHGLITYIHEPWAVHIAVSKDARTLVPAMLRRRDTPEPVPIEEAARPPAPKPVPRAPVAEPAERSWLAVIRDVLPIV